MKRGALTSGLLVSVGYDARHKILECEFPGNMVWQYSGVPKAMYEEMVTSKSAGTYFSKFIKNHFPARRMPEEQR